MDNMKKYFLVSLIALATASVALAADYRQVFVVPTGVTAVTNDVHAPVPMQLGAWVVGTSAICKTGTIAVVTGTYAETFTPVDALIYVSGTPQAVSVKQVVGPGDKFVVTLAATNAAATYVYVSMYE